MCFITNNPHALYLLGQVFLPMNHIKLLRAGILPEDHPLLKNAQNISCSVRIHPKLKKIALFFTMQLYLHISNGFIRHI